ncbi:acetolactate synthase [Bacillus sp. ISL-47]|uniref:thiamine pyrophosphate-dependent enzyme n=1 Tax=Bacillus sp. ISL-47 TaxID=2819130 RepID=UPI001BE58B48|nr:thiamine pyrophosphate-dependent enzyme [Bacillus sp. ISL-47]MBT2686714.1 acetolactate synthase [Bacillus sp. ISL-47]MBT2706938.1 acetolactate synthase [Pseudomonas sp. ISL-84]
MIETMTAAKAIVEVMSREGVEKAFCVPGESYLSVMDAMYDYPEISLISGRQEGGVAFMAEGYAKATGKVGVCLATRGPGATNLSIGLHTAYQDSTPLVAFIGQVESNFIGREGFQEVNLAEYFKHIVKWTAELREPSRVPELVHRAFHIARSGRPGPVVISLPVDILDQTAEMVFNSFSVKTKPRPSAEAIEETKALLEKAKRPVILAGGGVTHTKCTPELIKVAETLKIPVVTAFRRFDAFPNNHSLYAGSLGFGIPKYLKDLIQNADVILALGTRFSQVTTQDYTLINRDTKLIHVDISEGELNKVYQPALGIVSDVKSFLDDLLSAVKNHFESGLIDQNYAANARRCYVDFSTPKPINREDFVDLEGVMNDLRNELAEDTILTSDAGNFFGWVSRYFSFNKEGTYIGPTSGAMGYGLPAAIGAKLAHPDRPVIAISGDGGTMMTVQELETCVQYNIPVILIVVNNNMYGTIRMHQEGRYPKRVIGTNLTNPDFAELMRVMGGQGVTVERNKDFVPALQRALSANSPFLIEVLTDPQQISVTKTIEELRGLSANLL